ncbi:hypothetical protein [Hymenobacter lapidiphilus]|uniref:Outer membrane protein beta-barrel domain-containing protein n=1 Tax=Hymenobacter lapidiphilus TaxID=2608003 RepID=A0A7Y7PKV0_9BACT|nr:hypothetical protein [Hymenobacter lapidiphilus]NVO29708.1 hypothetical protein [Hymenobacter lapidiphilus]
MKLILLTSLLALALPLFGLAQSTTHDALTAAAETTTQAAGKSAKALEAVKSTSKTIKALSKSLTTKGTLNSKDKSDLTEATDQAKAALAAAKEANVAAVAAFHASVEAYDKVRGAVNNTETSEDPIEKVRLEATRKIAESSKDAAGQTQLRAAQAVLKNDTVIAQAQQVVQHLEEVRVATDAGERKTKMALAVTASEQTVATEQAANKLVDAAAGAATTIADSPKGAANSSIGVPKLIGSRNIKFGIGFGGSYNMNQTYSYSLGASSNAATNYALTRERLTPYAGVVSGIVAYNKTAYYFRKFDSEGNPIGEPEPDPYWLSALLAVNLADFTAAGEGFNRKLDLGIGVGIRFDEHFQLGVFLEGTSQRFLRDYYLQFLSNPVPDYKTNTFLTSLNPSDDNYFVSRTVLSVGFKLIYMLTADRPKEKDEVKVRAELTDAQ